MRISKRGETLMKNKTMIAIIFFCLFSCAALAQEPRAATLAQQKMCADQAKRSFAEDKLSPRAFYTSHYDPKANVCYIMTSDTTPNHDGTISTSRVVYDAFEGRGYANYLWISDKAKKFWEVAPVTCSVKPRGQDEITCKSSDEFDRLVDKHFGIGL